MYRFLVLPALALMLWVAAPEIRAGHHEQPAPEPVQIEPVHSMPLLELEGKHATMVRVTYQPGGSSPPHRHPGSVIVHVLEGEFQSAINDEDVVTYRAGESWHEPVGAVHRVAMNASGEPAVLLAILLHSEGDELVQPVEAE